MPKILIAEDDPQVAELERFYFERSAPSIEITVVNNGADCIAAVREAEYDLLLLDLRLPGLDGLAVLGQLSIMDDPTPVVVVSSHGDSERTVSAIRAGAVDCINKKTPQFLDIVAIAQRAMEQFPRELRMPRLKEREPLTVLFAEEEERAIVSLMALAAQRTPWLRIVAASSLADLERRLSQGPRVDAIIAGRFENLDDPSDPLRLCRSLSLGVPVLSVLRSARAESVVAAFHLGCYDCILEAPGYIEELFRSLTQVLRQKNRVRVFEGVSP